MPNPHRSSRQRGRNHNNLIDQRVQEAHVAQRQQRTFPGLYGSDGMIERRMAKWDQGAAELDAEMQRARQGPHNYRPIGLPNFPLCELCGLDDLDQHNGRFVHFGAAYRAAAGRICWRCGKQCFTKDRPCVNCGANP